MIYGMLRALWNGILTLNPLEGFEPLIGGLGPALRIEQPDRPRDDIQRLNHPILRINAAAVSPAAHPVNNM